ncbi:MAG: hypothetical protein ABW215_06555 [Kibdelosporangium sp.]
MHALRTWHRPLLLAAALMVGTLVLSLGGLLLDDRVLIGSAIWLKPFKFSVSIATYSFTLAWLISLLRKGQRLAWWMGTIAAVMLVVEMVAIVGQTFRGVPSHFNNATAFDAMVFQVMAIAIVTMWLTNAVLAVVVLRQRFVETPMLWAIRIGLLVALAGMAVAFMMPPPTPEQLTVLQADQEPAMIGGHSVGVADGGPGMPITGWSTVGGDLRIPHFLGIHALQVLPMLALLFGRFSRLADQVTRTRLTFVAAAGYTGLFGLVTWQALRGQSLVHPDGLTLGVLTLLVAAVALGATAVMRSKGKVLA